MLEINKIYNIDCFEMLRQIEKKSVNLFLTDMPYGTTKNDWDKIPDLELLWEEFKRIGKENCAFVFTTFQPFTTDLINSNRDWFKYEWVWDKINKVSGHLNAKKQPLRMTENIVVFYAKQPVYNPQMVPGEPYIAVSSGSKSSNYNDQLDNVKTVNIGLYYPRNLIHIKGDERGTIGRLHPTQKPVALMEYLIKTYSNAGDLVCDPFMGIGTTGIACLRTGRNYIGSENKREYCDIFHQRMCDELKDKARRFF